MVQGKLDMIRHRQAVRRKDTVVKRFNEGNEQGNRGVQCHVVLTHAGADTAEGDFENFFAQHVERRARGVEDLT
jgi:hypothetical protein